MQESGEGMMMMVTVDDFLMNMIDMVIDKA